MDPVQKILALEAVLMFPLRSKKTKKQKNRNERKEDLN